MALPESNMTPRLALVKRPASCQMVLSWERRRVYIRCAPHLPTFSDTYSLFLKTMTTTLRIAFATFAPRTAPVRGCCVLWRHPRSYCVGADDAARVLVLLPYKPHLPPIGPARHTQISTTRVAVGLVDPSSALEVEGGEGGQQMGSTTSLASPRTESANRRRVSGIHLPRTLRCRDISINMLGRRDPEYPPPGQPRIRHRVGYDHFAPTPLKLPLHRAAVHPPQAAHTLDEILIVVPRNRTTVSELEAFLQRRAPTYLLAQQIMLDPPSESSASVELRRMRLETLHQILQSSGHTLAVGWETVFEILNSICKPAGSAASASTESLSPALARPKPLPLEYSQERGGASVLPSESLAVENAEWPLDRIASRMSILKGKLATHCVLTYPNSLDYRPDIDSLSPLQGVVLSAASTSTTSFLLIVKEIASQIQDLDSKIYPERVESIWHQTIDPPLTLAPPSSASDNLAFEDQEVEEDFHLQLSASTSCPSSASRACRTASPCRSRRFCSQLREYEPDDDYAFRPITPMRRRENAWGGNTDADGAYGSTTPAIAVSRERFSYWCFDLLSHMLRHVARYACALLPVEESRKRVAALCLSALLGRCHTTLAEYVADENLRGNLPFVRPLPFLNRPRGDRERAAQGTVLISGQLFADTEREEARVGGTRRGAGSPQAASLPPMRVRWRGTV
ncbi:hypothetical protein FA95DRAFT_1611611 [Auriscalpium vulgare]|uniref:Uncharacterized protein n=1 Tax=Auriscalpium vulgare TaxID=40419 RepID=A0ACB8R9V3_9AGAM|nr:hypothetical protein FA95DRAFT_1611611 [Auriscalpium vulgare]